MNEQSKSESALPGKRSVFDVAYSVIESVLGWLFAGVFVLTTISVILRYFFNTSIYGVQEIIDYSFVYLSAIGAAVIIYSDEHIKVDFFTKASKFVQNAMCVLKHIVVIALLVFLFVLSIGWIKQVGQFETPLLHIEQRWMLYAIPSSMTLGILFSLCKLGMMFTAKKGGDEQ